MTDRLYMVLLDVQPAVLLESGDATITLKNEQGETIAPSEGMPGEYRLTKGYYYYEVAAEGYQTARGAFTIPRTSSYIDIRLQAGEAAPCEHDFTVETLRKEMCEAAGLARYTCNLCGLRYQDETKALGHDAVEDTAVKAGCGGPDRWQPLRTLRQGPAGAGDDPGYGPQLGRRRGRHPGNGTD